MEKSVGGKKYSNRKLLLQHTRIFCLESVAFILDLNSSLLISNQDGW